MARCDVALGEVFRELGRTEEARACLVEAERVFEGRACDGEVAVCQHDLAVLLYDGGQVEEAVAALRTVQPRLRSQGLAAVATCELNVAIGWHQAGRFVDAARAYERAHRAFVATGHRQEAAFCEENRAAVRAALGKDHDSVPPDDLAAGEEPASDDGQARSGPGQVSAALAAARRSIFRQEALEFQAKGPDPVTGLLRVDSPRVRWGYRLLLALVALVVALAALARVDSTTTGPAKVDPVQRSFVGLLPAVVVPDLEGARDLEVRFEGDGGLRTVPAAVVAVRAAGPDSLQAAGLPQPRKPSIVVEGLLTGPDEFALQAPLEGQVRVVLRSETVLSVLGQRIRTMLGSSGR